MTLYLWNVFHIYHSESEYKQELLFTTNNYFLHLQELHRRFIEEYNYKIYVQEVDLKNLENGIFFAKGDNAKYYKKKHNSNQYIKSKEDLKEYMIRKNKEMDPTLKGPEEPLQELQNSLETIIEQEESARLDKEKKEKVYAWRFFARDDYNRKYESSKLLSWKTVFLALDTPYPQKAVKDMDDNEKNEFLANLLVERGIERPPRGELRAKCAEIMARRVLSRYKNL